VEILKEGEAKLSGRPREGATCQKVKMGMKDALSHAGTSIEYGAITI
jgi:hypothetical protein